VRHGRIRLYLNSIAFIACATLIAAPYALPSRAGGHVAARPAHMTALSMLVRSAARARSARFLRGSGEAPLAFEANHGQVDRRVAFLARGHGYTLFLTATDATLALRAPVGRTVSARPARPARPAARTTVLRLHFVGADRHARIAGLDRLAGAVNYYGGRDRRAWRADIPTYARVAYRGLYPGVDLVYHGAAGRLEYDWVLAPGVDPGVVKMDIVGAQRARVDARGNLALHVAGGDVELVRPTVYQLIDGARRAVPGHFVLEARRRVGIAIGQYDTRRPLIIDPVLSYSTYLGGGGEDYGTGIAVDSTGNAYVTGYTTSTDFPPTGAEQPANAGSTDVFITKLTPAGDARVYSTYLGGSGADSGLGIAVDAALPHGKSNPGRAVASPIM